MLDTYIGQTKLKTYLPTLIQYCNMRNVALPHMLITGTSGLGKSTLATAIANEIHTKIYTILATNLNLRILLETLCTMHDRDILFLDEIHALDTPLQEFLYPILTDNVMYLSFKGKLQKFKLADITIIGATTHEGKLPVALLNRFSLPLRLVPYTQTELVAIVDLHSSGYIIPKELKEIIVKMARNIPRNIVSIIKTIKTVLNYSDKKELGHAELMQISDLIGINFDGLTEVDDKILEYLLKTPASIKTLSNITQVELVNLLEIYEPYLLSLGYIEKNARGRSITELGKKYIKTRRK